jgi:uncharacterized membrane protein YeaQ/YmgE (transglycosylase-associated protein family)
MGFLFAILLGGIIGWLSSIVLPRADHKPLWPDILAGMFGGLLGGLMLGPLLGGGNLLESELDMMTLVDAALGAAFVLGIVQLVRRRRQRPR